MAERFSIYAGPPIANVLVGYEDNRSGRLNQVADSYMIMIKELTPDFSVPEWCALCDALNTTPLFDAHSLRLAWASIADEEGLGDKWEIDQAALSAKVRALSPGKLIAMREIHERAWAGMTSGMSAEAAILRATAQG